MSLRSINYKFRVIYQKYNPFKLLEYLKRNFKNLEVFKQEMNSKREYILPGVYSFNNHRMKIAALKNEQEAYSFIERNTCHLLRTDINKIEKMKKCIRSIFDSFFKIKITKSSVNKFGGSLVMITGKGNIKIFDFNNLEIMSFQNKKEIFERTKQVYNYFNVYFNIPSTQFIDDENAYIEKLINFTPFDKWGKNHFDEVISKVLTDYLFYFSSVKGKKEHTYVRLNSFIYRVSVIKNNSLQDLIKRSIPYSHYQDIFPIIELHGDLNFQNILYADNKVFYIDWEFSRTLIFFFDLINLFFIEVISYNNFYFMDNFFEGSYDIYLKRMFQIWNLEYYEDYKLLYISLYIIENFGAKDLIIDSKDILWQEERYLHTFREIIRRYKNYLKGYDFL